MIFDLPPGRDELHLSSGCSRRELLNAMHNHVLEQTHLVGRYNE